MDGAVAGMKIFGNCYNYRIVRLLLMPTGHDINPSFHCGGDGMHGRETKDVEVLR